VSETEMPARLLTPELVQIAVISPRDVCQPVVDADLPELTHELNPSGSAEPVLATSSHEWFEGTVDGVIRDQAGATAEAQRARLAAHVAETGEPAEVLISWAGHLCQAYISNLLVEDEAAGYSIRFSFVALARNSEAP
jgi:hypothetical protein